MMADAINSMRATFLFSALIFAVGFCNGQFNDAQKKEMLDKHNEGRRQQYASDMNELSWDEALETEGQRLANTCNYELGPEPVEGITNVGQLKYWETGASNPVKAFDAWYGQHQSYDTATHSCRPGASCGSFRMVVKNDLTKLGCGVKVCNSFMSSHGNNAEKVTHLYVVCLYDNAPWTGPVFTAGKPCTRCPSGKHWCSNNLCQPSCTTASDKCQCYAKYAETCLNCGTSNEDDCTCKCADGFHGAHCTDKCKDLPVGSNFYTSCSADVKDDPEYFCTDLGAACCRYIRDRTCKATCSPFTKLCTPLTADLEKAATTGCTQNKPVAPAGR
ncbi:cysteine-rich venom protein VAR11-like [Lineus longissimus]|uniref:cysteine-rich venom protein VAR11-like n=1 Tax=Lineus longissimus TaxID=88925 RepID=UPI002B4D337E